MPGQVAPTGTQPPSVTLRQTSTGQVAVAGSGAVSQGAVKGAAPYLSTVKGGTSGGVVPTVGQTWPRGSKLG